MNIDDYKTPEPIISNWPGELVLAMQKAVQDKKMSQQQWVEFKRIRGFAANEEYDPKKIRWVKGEEPRG